MGVDLLVRPLFEFRYFTVGLETKGTSNLDTEPPEVTTTNYPNIFKGAPRLPLASLIVQFTWRTLGKSPPTTSPNYNRSTQQMLSPSVLASCNVAIAPFSSFESKEPRSPWQFQPAASPLVEKRRGIGTR